MSKKSKTYNGRDSQMVTHSSTSRPVQCLCMAERTGCPVFTDLWSYVLDLDADMHMLVAWRITSIRLCSSPGLDHIFPDSLSAEQGSIRLAGAIVFADSTANDVQSDILIHAHMLCNVVEGKCYSTEVESPTWLSQTRDLLLRVCLACSSVITTNATSPRP